MTGIANMEGAARIAANPHTATVLVGIVDGGVALLRADTGAIIWRKQVGGEITGLAHGGDIVYIAISSGIRPDPRPLRGPGPFPLTPITRDASGDPVLERDPTGRRGYHISIERTDMVFDLARVEARRATDGALLWDFTNTSLPNRAAIALDGETLAVCSPMNILSDESILFGLDARMGATRWRKTYTTHDDEAAPGSREETGANRALYGVIPPSLLPVRLRHVLGTRNGRFIVEVWRSRAPTDTHGPIRVSHRIEALDVATGALLWSHEIDPQAQRVLLSWSGALVIDVGVAPANGRVLTARRTSDGALVGTLTYQGDLRGVSDDGVAYVLEGERDGLLRALRINGASAESASQEGMQGKPDAIFVTRLIQLDRSGDDNRVEVRALDLETGATRWTWRSPENLMALLRLWGLRAPGAFAASVFRQVRKYGPALMSGIQREIGAGQWRHPADMHEYATRIDAVGDAVYLSGRLGVFALRVRDGQLLWSALPNVEVNTHLPLLVSPSQAS